MSEILLTASINGDIDMVSRLLVEGSDPNAMCDGETYPLIEACTYGHYDVVSLLLRNGANPNVVNGRSYTPLMAIMDACIGVSCIERDSIVSMLIENGVNVDISHLMHAVEYGRIDIASMIIEKGVDLNMVYDGHTPLTMAVSNDEIDMTALLLDRGADPNIPNGKGDYPLTIVSNPSVAHVILTSSRVPIDFGVRNSRGETPIMVQYRMDNFYIMKMMLEKGCCIVDNSILLDLVVDGRHLYLVDMIVSNGGGDLRTRYEDGNTLLIEAVLSLFPSIQIVNRLIREKGVDIDAQNDRGRTALMEASIRGDLYIVRVLLTHGAQPNIRDNEGNTALMMASRRGSINVCRELLSHGAYTYIKNNNGDTVSSMAATHDIRNLINSHPSSIYSTGGRV